MRYFVHVALSGKILPDQDGTDFPTLSDMQFHVIALAEELSRELSRPRNSAGCYIEVTDEEGRRVFALPIYREHFGVELESEPQSRCA